jgi:hypothetical protein
VTDLWRIRESIASLHSSIDRVRYEIDSAHGRDLPEWLRRNKHEQIRQWESEVIRLRMQALEMEAKP